MSEDQHSGQAGRDPNDDLSLTSILATDQCVYTAGDRGRHVREQSNIGLAPPAPLSLYPALGDGLLPLPNVNHNNRYDLHLSHKGESKSTVDRPVPAPRSWRATSNHMALSSLPLVLQDMSDATAQTSTHPESTQASSYGVPYTPAISLKSRSRVSQVSRDAGGCLPAAYPIPVPKPRGSLRRTETPECSADKGYKQYTVSTQYKSALVFRLRPYQQEISRRILQSENDIIVLPTNTGKTAVATNVMRHHLLDNYTTTGRNRKKKILFVVPRVVLADQQLEVIKQQLEGLPEELTRIKRLTGGDIGCMDELEQLIQSTEWSVIVATPQTVFNYFLAFAHPTMKIFSMIVLDECHNAVGNNPYNRLLHEYMDEVINNGKSRTNMPQIIGLTATVGIGSGGSQKKASSMTAKEHVLSLSSRLDLALPPTQLIQHPLSLVPQVTEEKLINGEYRLDPFSRCIRCFMAEIIDSVSQTCEEEQSLIFIKFKPPRDYLGNGFTQQCIFAKNSLTRLHDDERNDVARDLIISIKHLEIYQRTLLRANIGTLPDAIKYLQLELSVPEVKHNVFFYRFRDEWERELVRIANGEQEYPNEKLSILSQVLEEMFSGDDGNTRVIIFVEYRWLAADLSEWLKRCSSSYKAHHIVSANASVAQDGMTIEEARKVMENFRQGKLNILVSTSVLSEGINIPDCRGLIRYMFIKDVVAQVQESGRMRSSRGRIVAILDNKLQQQYRKNQILEGTMSQALQDVRDMDIPEFKNRVRKIQQDEFEERQSKKSQVTSTTNNKQSDARVQCQQCGSYLGELTSVRRYLEAHYLIVDKRLNERVSVKEAPEYRSLAIDGVADIGVINCMEGKCEALLGRAITIKVSGITRKAGIWDIEKIRLVSDNVRNHNFRKWEEAVKVFCVISIKQEELRKKAENGYFIL